MIICSKTILDSYSPVVVVGVDVDGVVVVVVVLGGSVVVVIAENSFISSCSKEHEVCELLQ